MIMDVFLHPQIHRKVLFKHQGQAVQLPPKWAGSLKHRLLHNYGNFAVLTTQTVLICSAVLPQMYQNPPTSFAISVDWLPSNWTESALCLSNFCIPRGLFDFKVPISSKIQ